MSSQTCGYVAWKDHPEEWHGEDSSEFWLDRDPEDGGLGISEWRCPHPPFEEKGADEDNDEKRCVFHTDADVPADRQQEELLDTLDDAGENPYDDRREHRGQFVGATFGAIDFSNETIAATTDYDIRFDHARFQAENGDHLNFADTTFETQGQCPISFHRTEFITEGDGDVRFDGTNFWTVGVGNVRFDGTRLTDAKFRGVNFGEADLRKSTLIRTDLREANIEGVSVDGETTCNRLYEGYGANRVTVDTRIPLPSNYWIDESPVVTGFMYEIARLKRLYKHIRQLYEESQFNSREWDATARAYHDLKTVFSDHGLVGKARTMYIRERRARSLEVKTAHDWLNDRYLRSLGSWVFTGYGVQIRNLVIWMLVLFLFSTVVYVNTGVRKTLVANVFYSVLAFTVAPPTG